MRYFICLLLVVANVCYAQTDTVLDNYLTSHRYAIKINSDSTVSFADNTLPAMLEQKMRSKKLFVYAEGFNHELKLNKDLRMMFEAYFATHGLKYYFEEAARSWVTEINLHIAPDITLDSLYWKKSFYSPQYHAREKAIHSTGHYEYAAIDFERSENFQWVVGMFRNTVDKNNLPALLKLAPYFADTSYALLSKRKFVQFYTEQRDRFYADSNSYKPLLGNLYPYYRYLMSDPQPSSYNNNRNRNMARHILAQIGQPQAGDVYLFSIGNGHLKKRDGVTKTTVGILKDSEQLKGKIAVCNIYCDSCQMLGTSSFSSVNAIKYMKGPALESFKKAATSDIVLFDLSELPEAYQYMTQNEDMLVFAKRKH